MIPFPILLLHEREGARSSTYRSYCSIHNLPLGYEMTKITAQTGLNTSPINRLSLVPYYGGASKKYYRGHHA